MKFRGRPWTDYSTKEQAIITYGEGHVCRLCNQQIVKIVNPSLPLNYFYHKTKGGKETNEIIQVAHQSVPHPSQLCYYHLNLELGNFNLKKGDVYHTY